MINKIINFFNIGFKFTWEYVILRPIFDLSYRLNLPKLSATVLVLLTKKLNGKKKYRVLCLGRSQFIDDIQALIDFGSEIQYLYFHKLFLGKIVRYVIPFFFDSSLLEKSNGVSVAEDGYTYHIDPKYKAGKERVYRYMLQMFVVLHKYLKFDAVLSGNYVYVDQQEFFKICEENHIPGIILNKEGIGAYMYSEDSKWSGVDGCRFIGSKILYLNNEYRKQEIKQLTGLEDNNTKVIGIPRFDYYFHGKSSTRNLVTLFSFEPLDYIPPCDLTTKQIESILEISERFHKNIMEFAINHPNYKVVIKAKNPGERYMKTLNEIYSKYFETRTINNLEITGKGNVKELILNSQVILGYNSTVLIEAIAARKTIISPYIGNIFPDQTKFDFFTEYLDLVNYANDFKEMENLILNFRDFSSPNLKRKNEFLDSLVYKADGKSSRRAENAIIETIEERKNH